MKKRDRVIYSVNNMIGEVIKVYLDESTGVEKVQVLTDQGIIFDKTDNFVPMDELLLRCNNCGKESYEGNLTINIDNQMYKCVCGSSTFAPLNLDYDLEIYNY